MDDPRKLFVEIDPSGMGLLIRLMYLNEKEQPVLRHSFSFAMDSCGHDSEKFMGAMAWRILELEKELAEAKESINILKPQVFNQPLNE